MAAFFLYKNDRYSEFSKLHPEKKIAELTKLISEEWMRESASVKEGFQQRYLEQKKRFDEQMKAYIDEHGKPPARKRKMKKEKGEKRGKRSKKEHSVAKKDKAVPASSGATPASAL